ncbi:putative protein Networked (NET), actin-binding (NAB) [Lupinus albus]|uniref:NAB domain-containing protein n=1 Tax=Lupinus albus TaxID=3870 RepID=A0A6A4PXQ0_LUPAL|nr:putative protein Networked (NET), actin-binding (NAB) [Lupinus albus]
MATLSSSESMPLYSWWWDSHFSPKNSKWLQENLTVNTARITQPVPHFSLNELSTIASTKEVNFPIKRLQFESI